MARKPVLAVAGVVLGGLSLVGCETNRSYCMHSCAMPPGYGAPAGYAQGSQPYGRPTSAYPQRQQVVQPAAATVEVGQPTQSAPGAANGTPMVMITLPAVKLMVPLNGTLTYAAQPGAAASMTPPADESAAARPMLAGPAPLEGQGARAPASPAPLRYPGPASPLNMASEVPSNQPRMGYGPAPAAAMTPTASSFGEQVPLGAITVDPGSPPSLSGAGVAGDPTAGRSRSGMAPPPPVWPRGMSRDDGAPSDLPPPIPRSPSLYSSQQPAPYQP